ncbi:hypothetical protein L202_02239 [Cryptococcus amylolentus CBS 6039]|uniref:Polynucleotide 5'-hydroxyl-kinase GRC3 n=1 Tax=Cryptococcus amylolentus CBS 6039 TaxID=1295533 RepID=A0A1E3HZZ1_9TREE|nr:hypothetical protein L202_02239 [Cryptococcus amylolentus CBS 6039]ODN81890.1 hypothetical protein L202_02239 [Cryptococcus amylolentus CBS 6039]
MSALAARRAAAIAASAEPQPEISIGTEELNEAEDSGSASGSGSGSESASEDSETPVESDEESVDIIVPSPKRRKTQKSRNTSPEPKKAARYFAATPETKSKGKGKARVTIAERQVKRYSPAALDSDEEEEEKGESVGDSDEDMAEDVYGEAAGDVDEGRVQWVQTNGAGSSRQKPQQAVSETTSNFVPQENVNLFRLSQEALSAAGLEDEFAGPGIIISLAPDESLVIAGAYILTLLQRSLALFSTTINPSSTPHPIYAPTSHPLPTLTPSTTTSTPSSLLSKLKLPKQFLKKNDRTILLIRENGCGIDGLRYGAVPGFANAFLEVTGIWGLRNVHPVIGSFPTPVYSYHTPSSWDSALASSTQLLQGEYAEESPFVGLVKGQKRSGKSTFARGLLNTLLGKYERVAWLECDLGQGEFGCGGVVGLWVVEKPVFGPPFTHPSSPVRAHYLGTYTPLTCPDEYISSIRILLSHFKYELQFPLSSTSTSRNSNVLPLIINTQGWVKGLGEELLRGIEVMAEPTHVFEFEAPVQEGGFSGPGWTQSPPWSTAQLPYDPSNPTSMVELEDDVQGRKSFKLEVAPVSPLQARYTPADLRVLSTLTYFHSTLLSSSSSVPSWDFAPLATVPPYEVLLSSAQEAALKKVYLIGEGSEGVVLEDVALALNGAMVALVQDLSADEEEEGLYVQGRLPSFGESSTTLGLALVRSVSASSSGFTLHLLTPLPPHALSRANAIVKNGALELPLPGWLDSRPGGVREEGMWGRGWDEVPFLEVGGMVGVVGGERRRFRKNIMRKGQ